MQLSDEDLLRLNVLLASPVTAIRLDDQDMTVRGLCGDQEAVIRLNPTGHPDQYLRCVRELLSGHVLGSPGGYPAFLQRWTRMGQARDARLAELLLLGEPEAVVAVAGAAGLTDELARRVWWILPTAEIARCMLAREPVVSGSMGKVLAGHLVDYLPFETEPLAIIATVRLVLQPGLIDESTRRRIWDKGRSKNVYQLGFLESAPDALPEEVPARGDFEQQRGVLEPMAHAGNRFAALLCRVLGPQGQSFLAVSERILRRPASQEAAICIMNVIGSYFRGQVSLSDAPRDMDAARERARARHAEANQENNSELAELARSASTLEREILAVLALSYVSETLLNPIFSHTTAVGTVMARKMQPLVDPILDLYAVLRMTPGR